MNAPTLVAEATRYLEAIDFFRSQELTVTWRSEADEVGVHSSLPALRRPAGWPVLRPPARADQRTTCLVPDVKSTTEEEPQCPR
jgi:hypothetical protein